MKKKEGFKGQRSVIIPESVIKEFQHELVNKQIYLTDIGFYPNARFHQRTRRNGCEQYILIYCIKGKGWFSIEGRKSVVHSNQFIIIPKDTPHSYGSSDKDPWSIYWIHFSGAIASSFCDPVEYAKTISPSKVARIEARIELFEEIFENLEMGYSKENIQYANVCLLHFLASFKYISQFRQIRKIRENDVVENAILFMKENITKKLSLHQLADESGISASHFSLLFRKRTERAPMDYLIHLRMQKASQLLDSSSLRINEVAERVGYDDPFHFSRIFKKNMGVSPKFYRSMLKG